MKPRRVTKDHINPKSRGGGPIVKCCEACNNLKADMPVLRWLQWLEENRPHRLRSVARLFDGLQIGRYVHPSERVELYTYLARFT